MFLAPALGPRGAAAQGAARASARAALDASDALPAATHLERVTWTRSEGVTRLEFHGRGLAEPTLVRASPGMVRLDFTAASASRIPRRLDVGTPEVASVLTLSEDVAGSFPDGVSARVLVRLADDSLSVSSSRDEGRVTVWVGVEEKAGPRGLVLAGDDHFGRAVGSAATDPPVRTEMPAVVDLLPRSLAVLVTVEQAIRATPSALSTSIGIARVGETKLADARRGDWLHLVGGGWIASPEVNRSPASTALTGSVASGPAPPRTRTPVAWSVMTLGTGLKADIEEVLPGDPAFEPLVGLFRDRVRLARMVVSVRQGSFAFQLPPKEGRFQLVLRGGRVVNSLDPRNLALVDTRARQQVDEAFDAPEVGGGETWQTLLLLPGDVDFLLASEARLDVGGQQHRMARLPGSGEPITGQDP